MAKYFTVTADENNQAVATPLKTWVRENGDASGIENLSDERTTHELRNTLKKAGWIVKETASHVYVVQPDASGSYDYADTVGSAPISFVANKGTSAVDIQGFSLDPTGLMTVTIADALASIEGGLTDIVPVRGRRVLEDAISFTAVDENQNTVWISWLTAEVGPAFLLQLLSTLGDLQGKRGNPIRAFLIADSFNSDIEKASRLITNIQLRKFKIEVSFI